MIIVNNYTKKNMEVLIFEYRKYFKFYIKFIYPPPNFQYKKWYHGQTFLSTDAFR